MAEKSDAPNVSAPLPAKTPLGKKSPRGRLVSGEANPVDVHVGKRMRLRRMMMGLSQEEVAEALGVAFQQVQKYECAINRLSATRLWELGRVLQCQMSYFFDGMDDYTESASPRFLTGDTQVFGAQVADNNSNRPETIRLVRAYNAIKRPATRKQILDLAASLSTKPEAEDD